MNGVIVQNDIRFAILEAFGREHIETPVDAARPEPAPREKWPADDEKIEAEQIERARPEVESDANPSAARKPKPQRATNRMTPVSHRLINAAFSCGSASNAYKIDAKGKNALQQATEAVETPKLQ